MSPGIAPAGDELAIWTRRSGCLPRTTRSAAYCANQAAYREDTRRWSNGEIFTDILTKCAHTRPHRDWCGYWQGNTRRPERLAA